MKDIEKRRAKDRRHYQKHKEEIKVRERKRYALHHDEIRARRTILNNAIKEQRATAARKDYAEKRLLIIEHYGGKCSCCGETEQAFLEIDHINNDGWKHRKEIGVSARAMVQWIIKNNYPNSIQLLCANCNQGKKRSKGICPHKTGGRE